MESVQESEVTTAQAPEQAAPVVESEVLAVADPGYIALCDVIINGVVPATTESENAALILATQEAERVALSVASLDSAYIAIAKLGDDMAIIPEVIGSDAAARADFCVSHLQAVQPDAKIDRKRACNAARYLASIMADADALIGTGKRWASKEEMFVQVYGPGSSPSKYVGHWNRRSMLEKDDTTRAYIPVCNEPELTAKQASVYQRVFYAAGSSGCDAFVSAERLFSQGRPVGRTMTDIALLLQAIESGAQVTYVASGKIEALHPTHTANGVMLLTSKIEDSHRPAKSTEILTSGNAGTAAKNITPSNPATTVSKVEPASDPDAAVKQSDIDAAILSPVKLDNPGAINKLASYLLASIDNATAAYVATVKAQAAYNDSLEKLDAIAKQVPAAEFASGGYKAVCDDRAAEHKMSSLYGRVLTQVQAGENERNAVKERADNAAKELAKAEAKTAEAKAAEQSALAVAKIMRETPVGKPVQHRR